MILADDNTTLERLETQDTPTQDHFPLAVPAPAAAVDRSAHVTEFDGAQQTADEIVRLADELSRPGSGQAIRGAFGAGFDRAKEVDNFGADAYVLSRQYQPVIEAINKGLPRDQAFPNPYSSSEVTDYGARRYGPLGLKASRDQLENDIWARVDLLRKQVPQSVGNIPASRDELHADALAEQHAALDYSDLTSSSFGHVGRIAGFAGQLAGGLVDPPNVLATVMGAPAASSLLRTFLIEGALNTAVDAAELPGRAKRYEKLGQPMSNAEIAAELGFDFLLGGAIPTGAKAVARAFARDATPDMRTAARIVEDELQRAQENPHAGDADGQDLMRQSALKAMDAVQEGRGEHLPNTQDQLGRALDPAVEAQRRRQGFTIESFDPAQLGTDAGAMQYKGGGDAQGVTDRLAGVTEWDPVKAGLALVWERQDGSLVIADGHQRLGLAKRLAAGGQQDISLYGTRFREADGFTAQDMRVIAALKNIAEGSGTGIDAARLLREAPEGVTSLPPKSPLVRQAKDLARLSDDAFGMAINGHASERDAAIVGRHVQDKDLQAPILKHLAENSPDTAEEAELFVRQAMAAGASREVQNDMFGDFIKADLILPQRVKILKGALTALRNDKALFSTLTDRAAAIQAAGNKLNVAENAARSETAARAFATLKALAERKGPISDALQQAAEEAARTGKRGPATARFVQNVRDAISSGELDRGGVGDTISDVDVAAENAALSVQPQPDPALEHSLSLFGDPAEKPEAFQRQAQDLAQQLAPAPAPVVDAAGFTAGQQGRSLEDLFKDAPARQRALDDAGEAIAKDTGAQWKSGGVKDRATAEAKLARKGYADAGQVTDITRGLFILETPAAADDVVHGLAQHFDVLDEGWGKVDSGYFDRKLLVRFAGGEVGEVQIRAAAMHDAVEKGGYDAFKVSRDKTLTQAQRDQALAKEQGLYSAAVARLSPEWDGVLSQAGKGGNLPNLLPKASSDMIRPVDRTSKASTSDQPAPGESTAAAREVDLSRTAGRKSQLENTSIGNTSDPKVGSKDGENKPEFGPAQAEIEAMRRLPQDDVFGDPLSDGETTVRAARRRMEREARAVEALRSCMGISDAH